MLMPSNVARRITDIPKFFWRYPMSYISYIAWSIEGQYKNDFVGLEFEPLIPGDRKIKGEVILKEILGIQTDYSKWWDVGVLVLLLISYRVLFYLALKHRDRASSILRTTMSE
ncbi:hypothetical protein Ahy_B06g080274 isoform C [Arachis hypogaea]|nr:hypothetical protein Ahy_B06g080274 isoform C [Arachis hypogaea]